MSTTYRGRLDVVVGAAAISVFTHRLNVVAFYLVGRMLFPSDDRRPGPALLDGSADALHHGRASSLWCSGLSEEVGQQLFKLVGHPSGALAMMGFRVLMYAGAGSAPACICGTERGSALTASAHEIEDEMLEGESGQPHQEGSQIERIRRTEEGDHRSSDSSIIARTASAVGDVGIRIQCQTATTQIV